MKNPIGLFEAYGIEIELMIVDDETLDVKPTTDKLLTEAAGQLVSDFEDGDITWSNELVAHVLEFKTTGPAPSLDSLEAAFQRSQTFANELLRKQNARLMPTGMHPWMSPETETVLWPHDNNEIYSLYDRIFDCRGHGWSNLQSVHINLPFASEAQFTRLHSAVRAILPIIPALSASTPICDGKLSGIKDTRLSFYETNQKSVPAIAGDIIPEAVCGYSDYREKISNPIQAAIRPYDPDRLLEGDWLNSRGAIARIDRGTIEIRLIDTQECSHTNLVLVQFIVDVLKALVTNDDFVAEADALDTKSLRKTWSECISRAEDAAISDRAYLDVIRSASRLTPDQFSDTNLTARDIWKILFERLVRADMKKRVESDFGQKISAYEALLGRPSLATRIEQATGRTPTPEKLKSVYLKLCECLDKNEIFDPKSLTTTEDAYETAPRSAQSETSNAVPHL